jgi:PAS domain S-box-containing protein
MPRKLTGSSSHGRAEGTRLFVLDAPLNMVMVDLAGRFVAVSPAAAANTELRQEQYVGKTIFEVYAGAEAGFAHMLEALATGEKDHIVVRSVRATDG